MPLSFISGVCLKDCLAVFSLLAAPCLACASGMANPAQPPAVTDLDVRLASAPAGHPRLLVSAGDLAALSARVAGDARLQRVAAAVRHEADLCLDAPPLERVMAGCRLLAVSRETLHRTLTLAMAFHLTGETRYARRAAQDLQAVSAFADWNPDHFLDVGEMTLAVAIGYDWLYDQLTEPERAALRGAIVQKGFAPSWQPADSWWVHCEHNWNQVCHGGLAAGAIALLTEEPAQARRILERAIDCVPVAMHASYDPDGAYPEGPAYWDYGTTFNALLVAMLEHALSSDFGLAARPGFLASPGYFCQMTAPGGSVFNYADCPDGWRTAPPVLFWFASRLHCPGLVAMHTGILDATLNRAAHDDRMLPLLLLWMPPPESPARPLPLDWCGRGRKPVAVHRSGWNSDACYVAVVGGSPGSNHGHMDLGSFVFEADGVRWALDLGMQDYAGLEARKVQLWDSRQAGARWSVFRYATAGHNTLMINNADLRVDAMSTIMRHDANAAAPFTVVDLSPAYRGQARAVIRGIRLQGRAHLVVADELSGLAAGAVVRWTMHTRAAVRIVAPDRAVLTTGGAQLTARLLAPAGAAWRVRDVSVPVNPWDEPNPGVSQLFCSLPAAADGLMKITVLLETARGAVNQDEIVAWGPPSSW